MAVVLFVLETRIDFNALAVPPLAASISLASLAAAATTVALVISARAGWLVSRKIARTVLSRLALFTLLRAVDRYSTPVEAISIGELNGNLVIRLPLGTDDEAESGQRFSAINSATGTLLGVIESFEVGNSSCSCSVSATMNVEFWEELESRMRREFSPPGGVIFSREIPDGFWDLANRIICHWGGLK